MVAIEPLAEMRAVLAEQAPAAELVAGRAEALPLADASLDALTVAQAFHWFELEPALAELARVLRPGAGLALVWNVRDRADPLQQELHALLAPLRGTTPSEHTAEWRNALAADRRFGPLQERSFAWSQPYRADDLVDRFASVSFIAALPERERSALLQRVRGLVAGLPEPFPFRYRTDVGVCTRL